VRGALDGGRQRAGRRRRRLDGGRQRARGRAGAEPLDRVDAAVTFVGVFDLYTPLADIADDRFAATFDEVFALNVRSRC